MPGQRPLKDLVNLRTLADALARETPEDGPAQATGDQEKLWNTAEDDWRRLWTGLLATLLAEGDGSVLELKTLRTLGGKALTESEVISKMPTVERAILRLLGCIKLERMMEERTLADYRAEVENRFRQVNEEAETWLPLAETLEGQLGHLRKRLRQLTDGARLEPGTPALWNENLATSFMSIEQALAQSRNRLKLLQSEFGEPAKEIAFVNALGPTWKKVDRSFGTWVRRLEPAMRVLAYGSLLALCAYLVIGMFIPTSLILWIGLGGVLVWAMFRYLKTRKTLTREIDRIQKKYSDELKPGTGKFWTAKPTHGLVKRLITPTLDEKSQKSDSKVQESGRSIQPKEGTTDEKETEEPRVPLPTVVAAGTCVVAYVLLTILGAWGVGLPPHFNAFVNQNASGSTCSIARGAVQWAGPGRVVLLDGNVLTVVAPHGIAGLSADKNMERCAPQVATRDDPPPDPLAGSLGELRLPKAIIIPFPGPVTGGCNGEFNGLGASLDEPALETLEMISDALHRCYLSGASEAQPPSIDVMGFASSKEFACSAAKDQSQLNLGLAEHRRRLVLQALGAKYVEQAGQWQSQSSHFQVVPDGWTRWQGRHADMKARLLYDHHNDPIARYVAIEVKHAGACTRAEEL